MYKEMNDQPWLKLRPAASIPSQVLVGVGTEKRKRRGRHVQWSEENVSREEDREERRTPRHGHEQRRCLSASASQGHGSAACSQHATHDVDRSLSSLETVQINLLSFLAYRTHACPVKAGLNLPHGFPFEVLSH